MASLTHSSRALLRAAPRTVGSVRALSTTTQKNASGESGVNAPAFESPFKASASQAKTSQIPDFSKYRSKNSKSSNLLFQYFMVGSMGAITAAGAKSTVQGTCIPEEGQEGSIGDTEASQRLEDDGSWDMGANWDDSLT